MLPDKEDQRMKRKEFQKFLFVGFVDRAHLEAAIHAQYPNLTEYEKRFIRGELDEMEDLMTKSSRDITAGLVVVKYEE